VDERLCSVFGAEKPSCSIDYIKNGYFLILGICTLRVCLLSTPRFYNGLSLVGSHFRKPRLFQTAKFSVPNCSKSLKKTAKNGLKVFQTVPR
jgi:hypothetical protein